MCCTECINYHYCFIIIAILAWWSSVLSLCLYSTILEFSLPGAASGTSAFFLAVGRFCVMFFASAAIGALFGLISAVVSFALGCWSLLVYLSCKERRSANEKEQDDCFWYYQCNLLFF